MNPLGTPLVSVVIATYNHAPFVQAAIQSVLSQEGVEFEVLVADDGSTDGTADLVSEMSDHRLHFESHRNNRGACVVTNELISKARGEYIAGKPREWKWATKTTEASDAPIARRTMRHVELEAELDSGDRGTQPTGLRRGSIQIRRIDRRQHTALAHQCHRAQNPSPTCFP